jgi:predicted site-specific integrase-resolvase
MANMTMTSVRRFRIGRACVLLGIERWRLKEWVKKNWVPCSKSKGNHVYFSIDDIKQIKEAMQFDAELTE